jgi:hypothetical protein
MSYYPKLARQAISFGLALLFLTGCNASTPTPIPPTAVPAQIPAQPILPTSTATPSDSAPPTVSLVYFVSEPGKFEIWLPTTQSIRESIESKATLGASTDCHVLFAPDNGAYYLVEYCDYPPELIAKLTTKEILDKARDEALQDAEGVLIAEQNISLHATPGRDIVADSYLKGDGQKGTYKARVYLKGNRLYRIATYVFNANWGNRMSTMDPFLDSFYLDDN